MYIILYNERMVRNVQISIRSDLLTDVDEATKRLGKSRSALIAEALRRYLGFLETHALEKRHIEGYREKPVRRAEFDDWSGEQVWPET